MFTKVVLALALFGSVAYVSAVCTCKQTKLNDIWQGADLVAVVKINSKQGGMGGNIGNGMGGASTPSSQNMRQSGSDSSSTPRSPQGQDSSSTQSQGQQQGGQSSSTQSQGQQSGSQGGQQSGQDSKDQITYDITIVKAFKPKAQSDSSSQPKTLTTPTSFLDCGVTTLALNTEYLIAATRNGSSYSLDFCKQFPLMDNGIPVGPPTWAGVPQDLKNKLQNGSF